MMKPPTTTAFLRSIPKRSQAISIRLKSSLAPQQAPQSSNPPKEQPNHGASSALDYKLHHPRARLPPLPHIDPPKWSAEEAVTNILYNTPPPSPEPFKRHTLNALVQNEPGVLSRVSGILAARGFNIDSLVVCATEIKDLSRMSIVLRGQDGVVEQARRQLEDLVPVWAVLDYTRTINISRELLLAKISILGPEYFEDQLASRLNRYTEIVEGEESPAKAIADQAREAAERSHPAIGGGKGSHRHERTPPQGSLTPSEALRQKHTHLLALRTLTESFGGRVVDVSHESIIVEVTGKTVRIDAFLKLVRPYGILEAARSGAMVMPRSRIESEWSGAGDEEGAELGEETEGVDSTLLPPG